MTIARLLGSVGVADRTYLRPALFEPPSFDEGVIYDKYQTEVVQTLTYSRFKMIEAEFLLEFLMRLLEDIAAEHAVSLPLIALLQPIIYHLPSSSIVLAVNDFVPGMLRCRSLSCPAACKVMATSAG